MKKNDLMRACPSLCSGRSTPPFPPIRRDIGRFAQQFFFVTFVPQKAVPPLPLLTLEGCPKDGVVSPLLTLEGCPKDGGVSPLQTLEGCPKDGVVSPLQTLEGCPKDGVVSPLQTLEGCPKDGVVLPLLTLEGCPKDGVVSAPSVVLTLTTETSSDTLPLISCFF